MKQTEDTKVVIIIVLSILLFITTATSVYLLNELDFYKIKYVEQKELTKYFKDEVNNNLDELNDLRELRNDLTRENILLKNEVKNFENKEIKKSKYNNIERDMLAKIVWSEARGVDEKGQILVVNTIINRVKSDKFPNTIGEVLFQKNAFSPINDGNFNRSTPTEENYKAVDMALSGVDYSKGALFFNVTGMNSYANKNRKFLFAHGTHDFFK